MQAFYRGIDIGDEITDSYNLGLVLVHSCAARMLAGETVDCMSRHMGY
jgi:hypothetical protein